MVKERRFKKAYGKELLGVAWEDFDSAQILADSQAKRKENIFFLCQQALEKALKGVLCWLEMPVPLTHDLNLIVDRIPKKMNLPQLNDAGDLTQFATVRRYEGTVAYYTQEEIQETLAFTQTVLGWAEKVVGANQK